MQSGEWINADRHVKAGTSQMASTSMYLGVTLTAYFICTSIKIPELIYGALRSTDPWCLPSGHSL